MKPSEVIQYHRHEIRRVVEQNRTLNPRVFGATLTGQDVDVSDLDFLVDPTRETTLLDIARIERQLEKLLGMPVDVFTPKALPERVRDQVLAHAVPV